MIERQIRKLERFSNNISEELHTLEIESDASERLCDELFIYLSLKSELELILQIYNQPEGEK